MPGVTPGVHPNPAGPYYIRRVRIASNSPLIQTCKDHNYHTEYQVNFDGSLDRSTIVVSFPCKVPETTPIASGFSWVQQLDNVRRLQKEWSDNSVSCTVYYNKEDIPGIKGYLARHFKDEMKTVSFLLQTGHGFKQAPFETISKEQYLEMSANVKPITSVNISESDMELNDCDNGSCPIK